MSISYPKFTIALAVLTAILAPFTAMAVPDTDLPDGLWGRSPQACRDASSSERFEVRTKIRSDRFLRTATTLCRITDVADTAIGYRLALECRRLPGEVNTEAPASAQQILVEAIGPLTMRADGRRVYRCSESAKDSDLNKVTSITRNFVQEKSENSDGEKTSLYVGRWYAKSPADCHNRTDDPERVPLRFSAGKLDFYETHCTVLSTVRQGDRITLRSACMSEGIASNETVTVTIAGPDKIQVDAYGAAGIRNTPYRRCDAR
ncbi:hypothetical protein OICFNHDK_3852 [Methylobacterium bullatum]|uniref:DUF3617 family protein n=1 Tax=Methylobacterium bullatum TaxID=570505 RepID=A0AAV4ZCX1_9HYPH|nr:hypothetical protein OICFNHDK_3852 [Methylobacterium bullatum]